MARTALGRRALERIALIEIRSLAGCQAATAVMIDPVPDPRFEANWRIAAVEGVPAMFAKRAIGFAQRKLRERYVLA
jgi:hypothetical protein